LQKKTSKSIPSQGKPLAEIEAEKAEAHERILHETRAKYERDDEFVFETALRPGADDAVKERFAQDVTELQ
jgi:hypothetical protein